MWLIITFVFALIVSLMHFKIKNKKLKLGFLALMIWGTFVMIFVDHVIAFLTEGGNFIEFSTTGLISNSALLGIAMVVPLVLIWVLAVCTPLGNRLSLG